MEKQAISSYDEAVEYIFNVPRFTKKNTMADTKAFLEKLGNPDLGLRIIHVAGTNGKGSVCAYMRSILETAGKRVAVFTSPHLVDVRERFVIDGEMISKEAFYEAFQVIYNLLNWEELEAGKGYHPTFFEYMFFIAMLVFKEAAPDYCILETGLGGRLDATNAVSKKELAVITRISLEHTEYLGDTITAIAGEKAGIMKENTPVVFADTDEQSTAVFLEMAKELSCYSFPVSKSDYTLLNFKNKTIDFSYISRYDYNVMVHLNTLAKYQVENCTLALRAIEVLDKDREISPLVLQEGVRKAFWPGRMEEVLPEIFVDGAHNADGVRAFLETVSEDGFEGKRSLMFSVVSDKDYAQMLRNIAESGLFDKVYLAHMGNYRATSLEEMKRNLPEAYFGQVSLYESVKEAFDAVRRDKKEEERVYIVGSLYLVGEIKEYVNHDKF
ncbi:MAG: bifunctional folylpolyglutamate synthase/dihydrofolate synthase [Lachnospiraceae bacterium]|nr:bifunctional folylpolyglutamate synthase/dihydrofolate synthase [Lachnospiraceae bacterium]